MTCNIVNNVFTKKSLTIDKLVKPRGAKSDMVICPGDPGWDEFLADFSEPARRLINAYNR